MMITELNKTIASLKEGKTILYPTDTVWGLGCDAKDDHAVANIFQIKQREESKSLIVLVSSLKMLKTYVDVSKKAIVIIQEATQPTTIIYKNPKGLSPHIITKDKTVAIRVVEDGFCKQLIQVFGKPIVSTSANISGDPTPKSFSEISKTILHSVDYIVDLQQDKIAKTSSKILRITDADEIEVVRE